MKATKKSTRKPNAKTTEQDIDDFLQWVDEETRRRGITQPGKLILLELIANDATLLGRIISHYGELAEKYKEPTSS